MSADTRTKVAVLGGGLGALSAVFALTQTPALRARYEVTVYQMGWRLGGKGASGRNSQKAQRIEEHGLHILMGWYQNAFKMLRSCYDEWTPPAGGRFAGFDDAFRPRDVITFMDQVEGEWRPWTVEFPRNPQRPGEGDVIDNAWDMIVELIAFLERALNAAPGTGAPLPRRPNAASIFEAGFNVFGAVLGIAREAVELVTHPSMTLARRLAEEIRAYPERRTALHARVLQGHLETTHAWLRSASRPHRKTHPATHQLYVIFELALAIFRGLAAAGFPRLSEFDKLDEYELRAWLATHGANQTALDSGLLRAFYDLAFAYADGDHDRPAMAAGAGLRALLRIGLGYKGSVLWQMQAGMGDTIFTPLYDVLKARGVKFQFFNKVGALHLDETRTCVEQIEIQQQAAIRGDEYQPLVEVNGLRCWPSVPDWTQIETPTHHVDFESHWNGWDGVDTRRLVKGRDFDLVVYGLSQASVPFTCTELTDASARWYNATQFVKTVQTQSVQLWLRPNRKGLGWQGPATALTSYAPPLSTWGDMSSLVDREQWPQSEWPGSIAYLCGAMPTPPQIPPRSARDYPVESYRQVVETARRWLPANAQRFWPKAFDANGFRWELLVDLANGDNEARFASQFFRANIDPSERYVQTVPGSTIYRLTSDDPDFANLFLAGDWVRSCINGGCVEGAVVGGLQAARAICGNPVEIQGE